MGTTALLMEGLNLMLLGMGIVFLFLILLVFGMHGMSWLAFRLEAKFPSPEEPAPRQAAPTPAADHELVAVISAAIARYRAIRH